MNNDDIQQIFFVECEESLAAAEEGLDAFESGTHDDETINAIFRAVHSIKGGAGAFGYIAMQAFTHTFETLLADVREETVEPTAELVGLLLRALDCLRDHVDAAQSGGDTPEDEALLEQLSAAQAANQSNAPTDTAQAEPVANDLDALLDELMAGDTSPPEGGDTKQDGENNWLVQIRPNSGAMQNGNEPFLWLRELADLGGMVQSCELDDLPDLDDMDVDETYLSWTFEMPSSVPRSAVEEIFDFVGELCKLTYDCKEQEVAAVCSVQSKAAERGETSAPEAVNQSVAEAKTAKQPSQSEPKQSKANQSVRIDLSKLDKLIDGVGELVIAQAMLTQRLSNENLTHIEELGMLDTLVRDIQEHAMAFRAQPISSVFSRVPRLLRELSGSTGKHVKLAVSGETTELDKTVIERLSEPLTHLIRNAIDHGIESAEERKEAGKNPEGTLTLSAEQKAGRILIRIADDGKGIDRDVLRNKAIANDVVDADTPMTDEEIYNLVFSPGLSTAKSVSNISGRGVGMDVVRQNVKELGGRITIDSSPGKGTTFTLALPLTLAISDGMIVQVGDQSLVIPLTHVVESLSPETSDLKGMGSKRQLLNVRGQFVPIVSLSKVLGGGGPRATSSKGVLVVVETEGHGCAALLVDAIQDQRQFVIKSLDTHFHAVDSVAGATILGNGRVALIIDVDRVVQTAAAADAVSSPVSALGEAA